ncbi:MAG: hypothetical protein NTX91_02320 [candidate division SR1 bacterium]|nr:hypothetical protein [candidate division SR1 bacterium]
MTLINQAFIEQLLFKAMPDIDDAALEMMSDEVEPVLYDWVVTHLATKFNDEQMGTFADLIEKKSSYEEMYKFLEEAIPGYEEFIAKVYDDFEAKYLEDFAYFHKEMKNKYTDK